MRDPRVDPRVGDVLRNKENSIALQVSSVDTFIGWVEFWRHDKSGSRRRDYRLASWQDVAKHYRVIHVAEG